MRLNAFLAKAGVASRRGADELIKAGRITVNDQPGSLNSNVGDSDVVKLDGRSLVIQTTRYILLNKPKHTVTTLSDPEGRPTVTSLTDIKERVVPVGRLDTNTTGALLLTNDGNLAHHLMHPSFEVDKVYEADVVGDITDQKIDQLRRGVQLADGRSTPAKVRKISDTRIELTIHEGRKHQVKRMLAAVGLPVVALHRSEYSSLTVDGLKRGQWRDLSESEVEKLKQ